MSLVQTWGFGAELTFRDRASATMTRARRAATALRGSFDSLREAGARVRGGLTTIGALLGPLGLGLGFAAAQSSSLAGNLEAQKLTMRVLLGDVAKADELLAKIRANAAATPFAEGDLIEGSKRLLRLTGQNVDANIDLLETMETMAALNPTKSVVDAVEAILDATSGGGFERLKEFGLSFKAEDFEAAGRPGGQAWADAVILGVKDRMTELTRGEDLVGALSQTFLGRLSTLKDAGTNIMRSIGEGINAEIGPSLATITDRINDSFGPAFIDGFRQTIRDARDAWDAHLQPIIDRTLEWWDALGPEGRANVATTAARVLFLAGAVGTLMVALAPAAIAGAGFVQLLSAGIPLALAVGQGLLFVGTAASTVLSGVAAIGIGMTAILALIAGLAAGALLYLTGVAAGFVALFERSAVATNILPLAVGNAITGIRGWFDLFIAFGTAAFTRFREIVGIPIQGMLERLQPPFDRLVALVIDFLNEIGGIGPVAGDAADAGRGFGDVLALILYPAIGLVEIGLEGLIFGMRAIVPMATQLVRWFRRVSIVISGLADGSLSAQNAMSLLLYTAQQGMLSLIRIVSVQLLHTVDFVLRMLQDAPGIGAVFGTKIATFRASLRGFAEGAEDRIDEAIAKVEAKAKEIERARTEAAKANVTVNQPPAEVAVKVDAALEMDGRELARSAGRSAASAGQRGTGPPLSPTQQGRVLRHGLTVTPLLAHEAF